MDCHIPAPNPYLTHWMGSRNNMALMREVGGFVRDIAATVTIAKDTGALAASGRVVLSKGGIKNDRYVADVVFGVGTPRGGYGASHEYGIGIHPRSRVPPTPWMPQKPTDELERALKLVDTLVGWGPM